MPSRRFQSAPPGEGDVIECLDCIGTVVSIRAPGWGRRPAPVLHLLCAGVSIRAPGWGRPAYQVVDAAPSGGFNPRSRVGATGHPWKEITGFAVSIRAPGWGRRRSHLSAGSDYVVSIRAPGWGRQLARHDFGAVGGVSIRAPGWGRPIPRPFRFAADEVSIRAPGWGRPSTTAAVSSPAQNCFNPRPRVGATKAPRQALCRRLVSIRAPGWGRRSGLRKPRYERDVSIRAPGWGRPTKAIQGGFDSIEFQSAPPGGGDDWLLRYSGPIEVSIRAPGWGRLVTFDECALAYAVSIRAPGWGRPLRRRAVENARACFNPRPRVGATLGPKTAFVPVGVFQSAPPGGGDLSPLKSEIAGGGFNPRPRVGATATLRRGSVRDGVSIRAPGWGRP